MDKLIGKKLDGVYEIQSLIGCGGMANVYRGVDLRSGTVVAVKVLREEYMHDQDLVRRFKNESKAISILNHPNIVKVYDVSVTDKLQYIVMEYIDGITLKEYLNKRGGRLTWRESVHFVEQILYALQHAHENGVVHRDVKPQNIMLLPDGSLKMMDFGIARISRAENQLVNGKTMGSVHYISPEQARGDETDAKSDLYSVGVMLYEMLSGKLPFSSGSVVEVAIQQISDKPQPLAELAPDIPRALVEITERAMAKNPANRYQSAAEMLEDLRRFKQDPEIRFAYKYMTDESSEKVIDKTMRQKKTGKTETQPTQTTRKTKKKRSAFLPVLFGITAAFCIACAVLCLMLLKNSSSPLFSDAADLELPDLTGLTREEVEQSSVYDRITIKWEEEYNSSVEAGLVYRQSPRAQRTVKEGQIVTLTVSLGTKYEVIPDLRNAAQDTAEATLKDKGFHVLIVQTVDSSVAVGAVIRTDPEVGTTVEAGSTIMLYVSRAQVATTTNVPDVLGRTVEDAQRVLAGSRLSLGAQTHVYSNEYPAGVICGQGYDVGTEVRINSRVPVYISDGPEPTPEPTPLPTLPEPSWDPDIGWPGFSTHQPGDSRHGE